MSRVFRNMILLSLMMSFGATALAGRSEMERVNRMLRQEQWAQAAAVLEAMTEKNPDHGLAWYNLSIACYKNGNNQGAYEATLEALRFPRFKASAQYNIACFHALKGENDKAKAALDKAFAAGFADYDTLRNDPELESLRKKKLVTFPHANTYKVLKAHNGIKIPYKVLLPENYDKTRSYDAMLFFPSGQQGKESMNHAIQDLFGDGSRRDWIVVCPAAPKEGWYTHPSHHALNELMDKVRDQHRIKGNRFHLVGYRSGGYPAFTYANMSRSYFQSVTIAGGYSLASREADLYRRFRDMPVYLFIGARDSYGTGLYRDAEKILADHRARAHLVLLKGDGPVLNSLKNGGLLHHLDGLLNHDRTRVSGK